MATVVLEAKGKSVGGTGAARRCRREGFIPCIIYGDKKPSESICISKDLLSKYVHRSNFFSTVFVINGVGKKDQRFVAKDIQFHPVTDNPIHIDFMRVGKNSKVTVRVPLAFINEAASPGLKMGGVLNVLIHEVDVVCDPESIPEKIEVDLTGFEFHHTVHAYNIKLGENINLPVGCKNFTIATVVAPTIMKKEEEAVVEPAADAAGTTPSTPSSNNG
ncbi:MAG: 50S ribosomal protein L25/general stress protein Ctc [Holosporaceae bacterium]|jgi:large subunit ribosomal protein L25|nr:50S ribosomal protein L25/general stress protein Ctc [Holosporaceae bacterium]